jgi:catechol 2,3-dioxygenase-like lactoylglutathione lyase family enzyme
MSKKNVLILILSCALSFVAGYYIHCSQCSATIKEVAKTENKDTLAKTDTTVIKPDVLNSTLKLGAFSMSLSVKDLNASKQFYETLGFVSFGGALEQNYLIMKNGNALIGLFQGMFEGNMLTFNPGWDENAQNTDPFDDVRVIQQELKKKAITLTAEADETTVGPASLIVTDPDGNVILIDQHR